MNITKSRMAAVAAGAVALVAIAGTGGAVAGALVTSADIADGTIQKVDLKSGAVTSGKIRDGGVKSVDIADGSITAGDLAAGTIPAAPKAASYKLIATVTSSSGNPSLSPYDLVCDAGDRVLAGESTLGGNDYYQFSDFIVGGDNDGDQGDGSLDTDSNTVAVYDDVTGALVGYESLKADEGTDGETHKYTFWITCG